MKVVAVLLFDGVNALDVTGPSEAFATARTSDELAAYNIVTVGLSADPVKAESGLGLCVEAHADNQSADLLIIPGGRGIREPSTLACIAAWLKDNEVRFTRIASVCTGAYALAEAGLLDGRKVATHWAHIAHLQRCYPRIDVVPDALFLADGKYHSSGGVTAGIDLALDIIARDLGGRAAMDVARELVVFLRRTGGQTQFSNPLQLQAAATGGIGDACTWAANNLGNTITVAAMAERAGLSQRQFSRRFTREIGSSPGRYVQDLRLEQARLFLTDAEHCHKRVADMIGFRSAEGFRRAFERRFGVTPSAYRDSFSSGSAE